MSKITSGSRVRIFTAEELNIDPATYRYTNHGGVAMWAAFPAPNNPHVFYLTADKDAVTDVCPWSKLEQALEKTGINHMVRQARINELKRKYIGPVAFNCLELVDAAKSKPMIDVSAMCQSIDAQCMVERAKDMDAHGRELVLKLNAARRQGIINYLKAHDIPFMDAADNDGFALEA